MGAINRFKIQRSDGEFWETRLKLDESVQSIIDFAPIPPRTCKNHCVFCFVDQLPTGVRHTLKIKDEDYRHSFLEGNFITLGNLNDSDVQRILDLRLSPLYVSVHATNPEIRRHMVRCPKQDRFFDFFRTLVDGGITLHTQVVLCPGINDGKILEQTIAELSTDYPTVASVGVVPVGLTCHRSSLFPLQPFTSGECRQVVLQIQLLQKRFRRNIDATFVYLADEFYLQGGIPLPPVSHYDDFPQYQNGIGMVRSFLDDVARLLRSRSQPRNRSTLTCVTGRLFAPVLSTAVARYNDRFGTQISVTPIENHFLGSQVTVAGLLAGGDIIDGLEGKTTGDVIGIPMECTDPSHHVFLDDLSVPELAHRLKRPVWVMPHGAQALHDWRNGSFDLVSP